MLAATYLTAVIVVALSVLVGRGIMAACGRRQWSGLEPAVGFAALIAVEGLLARFPGNREGLLLGLVAIFLLSLYLLRQPDARKLPGSPWLWTAVGITVLLTAVPFIISGRWGLLGMGYNNDLGLHLAWAESLRSGFGTEPSPGYPLGPHGLVASLSYIPGISLGTGFIGLVVAIPVLTAMTGWYALDRLSVGRRLLATVLVAFPYLMASYFVQSAFKEIATAMLLLAFTLALPSVLPLPASHRERLKLSLPLLVLLAGIVFTYSFPGLAFPAAVTVAWLVSDPDFRSKLSPAAILTVLRRPLVAAGVTLTVVLLLTLAFLGPFGFGDSFAQVATSDAFGPVSAVEAFGVWLTSDYRLDGAISTPLPGVMTVIAITAAVLSLWWWYRQPRSIYPVAFLACVAFYLASLPWVGDYSLAKALVISSPIIMVVILTALLSGPMAPRENPKGGNSRGVRLGWTSFATLFVVLASASSLLVLRDASVPPPGKVQELAAFHEKVAGKSVLYADQDRFAPSYFPGSTVSLPLKDFPEPDVTADRKKPFEGASQSAIDFDSFDAETLNKHDYVITTSAGWTSKPPPSFELVDQTASFKLWRRTGRTFERPILNENDLPARLVDCSNEGGRYFSALDGDAVLMPETVLGPADGWSPSPEIAPGGGASQTLDLDRGLWRVSMQYFTPAGMTLTAPGYARSFKAAIDGQRISNQSTGSFGQFWAGGVVDVKSSGPVEFTVKTAEPSSIQKLTGYSRETKLGRIALTRAAARKRVPLSEICDEWVDFFRLTSPDSG
jgi:hypothetical protein